MLRFLGKIADATTATLIIIWLVGELLSRRWGLCLIQWFLACIAWYIPVATIDYFIDPNCDHALAAFILIALLGLITLLVANFFLAIQQNEPRTAQRQ